MNIDQVASQIRTLAPLFAGNVAGAAAYANGVADQVWLPSPAAYVIPLSQDAEENTSMTGLYQIVRERVGVIVVLETLKVGGAADLADRRGQAASAYIDTVKYAIFRAILNWRPDWDSANPAVNREGKGLSFVGAEFPEAGAFDRARFFYQFVFQLETTITDADGWLLGWVPLTDVGGTITDPDNNGQTRAVFDVPLPTP
jgi:hypothetical protein